MSKPPIPPMPDLDWRDIPDIHTLPWRDLKDVPHRKGRWLCCAKDCLRSTIVRDFGLYPRVYSGGKWVNLETWVYWCRRHYKPYREALNRYQPPPFPLKTREQLLREVAAIFPPEPPK